MHSSIKIWNNFGSNNGSFENEPGGDRTFTFDNQAGGDTTNKMHVAPHFFSFLHVYNQSITHLVVVEIYLRLDQLKQLLTFKTIK